LSEGLPKPTRRRRSPPRVGLCGCARPASIKTKRYASEPTHPVSYDESVGAQTQAAGDVLVRTEMIDHVYISVTNIEKSLAFYTKALKPLGWRAIGNYHSGSGPEGIPDLYGICDDAYGSGTAVGSSIWLRTRAQGETGLYLGLVCDTNELVDAAYAAA